MKDQPIEFNQERAWARITAKQRQVKRNATALHLGLCASVLLLLLYFWPAITAHPVSPLASSHDPKVNYELLIYPDVSNPSHKVVRPIKETTTSKKTIIFELPNGQTAGKILEPESLLIQHDLDTIHTWPELSPAVALLPPLTTPVIYSSSQFIIMIPGDKIVLRVPSQADLNPTQKSHFAKLLKQLAQNK